MNIVGLQKVSLLNYPGLVSATIYVNGCNFRCPFCHNSSIVKGEYEKLSEDEVFKYLEERKKMLDGVCVSGGEPTTQKDLKEFILKLKNMGFKVKLDTNGYNPSVLKQLIDLKCLDYIAMDIKNSDEKYSKTAGVPIEISVINESIELIMQSGIDYEFRTTVVEEFHSLADIEFIAKKIKGANAYYIQNFEDSGDIMQSCLHGFKKSKLEEFVQEAKKFISNSNLRGID